MERTTMLVLARDNLFEKVMRTMELIIDQVFDGYEVSVSNNSTSERGRLGRWLVERNYVSSRVNFFETGDDLEMHDN